VLELMADLVDGLDIASGGELAWRARRDTCRGEISFAGPGKTDAELLAAMPPGVTLNLESAGEARRALAIGTTLGVAPRLAIRVNPDFELRGSGMKMGGGAKPFGVDEGAGARLAREIIDAGAVWRGLHIYTGSQALDAGAVIEMQGNVLDTWRPGWPGEIGAALPHLNMGGGFGIPYFDKDQPLDIAAVGAALAERFANLPAELADTEFAIELGRYLVGEAGVYLTRIVDRKVSHGQVFLVTDGGLHHQLAASGNFGTVVRRNYPWPSPALRGRSDEEANVVGCLCTPLDRLADQAMLPRAEVGDLVAVFCAGAYGASASPALSWARVRRAKCWFKPPAGSRPIRDNAFQIPQFRRFRGEG
jgi:diaminopimelate decarboxylase